MIFIEKMQMQHIKILSNIKLKCVICMSVEKIVLYGTLS